MGTSLEMAIGRSWGEAWEVSDGWKWLQRWVRAGQGGAQGPVLGCSKQLGRLSCKGMWAQKGHRWNQR